MNDIYLSFTTTSTPASLEHSWGTARKTERISGKLLLVHFIGRSEWNDFYGHLLQEGLSDYALRFRLAQRTYSFWGYVERQTEEFLNPIYNAEQKGVLRVDLRPQFVRYESAVFLLT